MPDIGQPSASDKNSDAEIRDAILADGTRFDGANINLPLTETGAPVAWRGRFQVANADFTSEFDVSDQTTSGTGVRFNSDGSKAYVNSTSGASLFQYDLSTAFDLSTASFSSSASFTANLTDVTGFDLVDNDSRLYICDGSDDDINQFDLSTPGDVTTASFVAAGVSNNLGSRQNSLTVSADGTQMYVAQKFDDQILKIDVSTPFDVTTATAGSKISTSSQTTDPTGIRFDNDGERAYVCNVADTKIYKYDLSTPFDFATKTFSSSADLGSRASTVESIEFSSDGSIIYTQDSSKNSVLQFSVGKVVGDPV